MIITTILIISNVIALIGLITTIKQIIKKIKL